MYIIVIAWLYVTILMAATETSVIAGLLTLILYGGLPVGIFLYVFGTPARRRAKMEASREAARSRLPQQPTEPAEQLAQQPLDPVVGADHGHHPEQN